MLFSVSCTSSRDFDRELDSTVKSYRFSTVGWEFKTIIERVRQYIWSRDKKVDDGVDTVTKYLALGSRIKTLKAEIGATNREELQSEVNDLERQRGP